MTTMEHGQGAMGPTPTLRDLLPQHLPHLERYVRSQLHRTLRDAESATDLVNSVCGDLLEQDIPFEYRGDAQFLTWLHTVVVNKIRQRLRFLGAGKRDHRRLAVFDPGDGTVQFEQVDPRTPSQDAVVHEDLGLLDRSISMLPEHYRELVVRVHLRGESHRRVAEELGRSEGATRTMMMRALAKLAGIMDRLQQGD